MKVRRRVSEIDTAAPLTLPTPPQGLGLGLSSGSTSNELGLDSAVLPQIPDEFLQSDHGADVQLDHGTDDDSRKRHEAEHDDEAQPKVARHDALVAEFHATFYHMVL